MSKFFSLRWLSWDKEVVGLPTPLSWELRAVGAAMSFDGMRRPSFSQANVQIAGASELMSPASEPNTLVVPVCALVPTPDGGHGMYVSVSGASPFLFIPVTLVERARRFRSM